LGITEDVPANEEPDMLFVVYCKDKPGELRSKLRADHLRHIIANPQPYRFGGPLIGDDGRVVGSIILFEAEDRAHLDAIMAADPYFKHDLFQSVEVHATRQIIPELEAGALQRELTKELERRQ
jgi:uncharacterized protein YciI